MKPDNLKLMDAELDRIVKADSKHGVLTALHELKELRDYFAEIPENHSLRLAGAKTEFWRAIKDFKEWGYIPFN